MIWRLRKCKIGWQSATIDWLLALGLNASLLLGLVHGQDTATKPEATASEPPGDARAQHFFGRFATTAATLDLVELSSHQKYLLVEQPLFRFTTEGTVFGSVYVWQDAALRLAAIGTIGALPIFGKDMEFVELHLLKPVPIVPLTIKGEPDKRWNPTVDGLQLRPIADAPPVAPNDRLRLTQMRSIARLFAAEMRNEGQVNQLRLLPQPLYRYSQSTEDRDGALFAFVWDKGTDPELILRVEATKRDEVVGWHYQPIRFTWRELRLQLRGAEVWRSEEFVGRDSPIQNTPYITGLTEVIP